MPLQWPCHVDKAFHSQLLSEGQSVAPPSPVAVYRNSVKLRRIIFDHLSFISGPQDL